MSFVRKSTARTKQRYTRFVVGWAPETDEGGKVYKEKIEEELKRTKTIEATIETIKTTACATKYTTKNEVERRERLDGTRSGVG